MSEYENPHEVKFLLFGVINVSQIAIAGCGITSLQTFVKIGKLAQKLK